MLNTMIEDSQYFISEDEHQSYGEERKVKGFKYDVITISLISFLMSINVLLV